ncbi:Major Facilitator Superfamily [Neisseria animaloris]|uniref:Major Facilitator Superfamily n=2 Tax=Neisseria animaloris TaxID=326522 RepID=A0A3S4YHW3_9NEIS|nr:Major Facilitator Superfamily [Neisseria animaloris]
MTTTKQVSQRTGISMFFILLLAYITFAASWVGGSTLSPQILETYFDGHVSSVVGQVINYTITIARIFANFLAAYFLIKLGVKKAVTLALGLLCFSLIAVWLPNYWFYTVARMIMALGGSMIMVYMNPIVARFVSQHYKLTYSALITASYNIGAFIIAVLFTVWSDELHADWRITLSAIALLTVILFTLWLVKAENFDTAGQPDGSVKQYGYKQALADPFIWKISLGFGGYLFLYVMSLTSLPAIFPKHVDTIDKSMMLLAVSGGGILGTLIMMRVKLERTRRPVLLLAGAGMIGTMAAAFLTAPAMPAISYLLMFASGCIMFMQYPVFLNLPHELPNMSPQRITIMFGLIWALAYSLYTILNFLWSLILDHTGWTTSLIFYFTCSCLYLLAVYLLPETYRKTAN